MNRPNDAQPATGPPEADGTSVSLLVRLRANDAAAWDRLVLLYAPLVYYWCRKLHLPEHDADDVFQDVFQSVAARITTFRKEMPRDTFRGWLRIITQNKVHDHFRRVGRQPQAAGGTEANLRLAQLPAAENAAHPDDDAEKQAYQELVQRALDLIRSEFASRTWQAFWRVAVDGQPPADVARELAMQPGNVRVAKSRVLRRLRQELGELLE
jgi:RNA polymerase sigma-70 factor (ECF subfamily)